MAKDKIIGLATGKELVLTPEERVRQDYIKILIEDYGYNKEDIKIEYPVKRSPSDTRKSLPVDIVVEEDKIGIHYVEKIVKGGKVEYKDIFDIPEKGFFSTKEQLKKSELKPTSNLKNIFK